MASNPISNKLPSPLLTILAISFAIATLSVAAKPPASSAQRVELFSEVGGASSPLSVTCWIIRTAVFQNKKIHAGDRGNSFTAADKKATYNCDAYWEEKELSFQGYDEERDGSHTQILWRFTEDGLSLGYDVNGKFTKHRYWVNVWA